MTNGKKKWIDQEFNKRRLQHIKAKQIQRHWRYFSCNPNFKLAKRRLLYLYLS